jgi:hypothetical protein
VPPEKVRFLRPFWPLRVSGAELLRALNWDDAMIRVFQKRVLKRHSRAGYSLLEVVLASSLCATALVGALAILRDGMTYATNIDTRQLILIYGVSKMEEQLAVVAASWATGTVTGDYSADGYPTMRYSVTRSDSPASGGLTNQLMVVGVTVYSDANNNGSMDTAEMRTTFSTKIGKMANYQSMAGS